MKQETDNGTTENREAWFEQALTQFPDPALIADAEGGVRFASQSFCEWFGAAQSTGETAGIAKIGEHTGLRNLADFLERCANPAREEREYLHLESVSGKPLEVDAFITPLEAEPRLFLMRLAVLSGDGGPTLGRPQLYQALEQKIRELEAANHELESFASAASHDLRVPLRFVTKFAHLLITNHAEELSREALQYAELIQVGTKQMAQLVEDLLDFSRAMKQPLRKQSVDMTQLAREIVQDLAPDWEGREIDWTIEELGTANADPAMLKQALYNLVGNAVKFTRPIPKAQITIGVLPGGESPATYFVRDNGAGFPPEMAEELFTVFTRCHQPEDFEGTGVGLALVKQIIERHGGKIWAEGQVDAGAVFHFTLQSETPSKVQKLLDTIQGGGHAGG